MKKCKEALSLLIGIGLVVLWMSATGFGCPIKRITGISCAGCGMSRALLAAAHLQFNEAFYYHPLFWLCPIIIALYVWWERIPPVIRKHIFTLIVICFCSVYVLRLFFIENNIVVIDVQSGLLPSLIQKLLIHMCIKLHI